MSSLPKVLILDDQQLIAYSLAAILEDNGFEVVGPYATVSSALQGIETLDPDIAILDINMGDGTTSEPLADILMDKQVPFAFVTGYGSVVSISSRFNDIVKMHKPVRTTKFVEMVKSLAA
jgi:two-component SAPR family response regulator